MVMNTAPATGQICARCHRSRAVILFADEALCADCDDGAQGRKGKTMPKRLTAEQIQAIKNAPASELAGDLAARLGVDVGNVYYHRKKTANSKQPSVVSSQTLSKRQAANSTSNNGKRVALLAASKAEVAPASEKKLPVLWRANMAAGRSKNTFHFRSTEDFGEASHTAELLLESSPMPEAPGNAIVGIERICRLWN